MDMENIANVNANYSASESHKVTSAPAETVHTAATTVSETAEAMTRTVMASGSRWRSGYERKRAQAK